VDIRLDGQGKRGGPGAAIARQRPLPRRRFTGGGRSRPSGPHFERHQVLEVEHDALNTPRRSGKQFRARVGASHDGGGTGSRRQRGRACAEGNREGKGARRVPYLPWKLRWWLAVGDRWHWGELRRRGARSTAAPLGRAVARQCKSTEELGRAVAAEGKRERAAGLRKGVRRPRRAGRSRNGPRIACKLVRVDLIEPRRLLEEKKARVLASGASRVQGKEPGARRSGTTASGRAAGRRREKQGRGRALEEGAERKRGADARATWPEREREEGELGRGEGNGPAWPMRGKGKGRERAREGMEREEGSWAAGREPAQEIWAAFLSSSFSFPTPNHLNNLFEFK
jgi:hypothetical protein